MINDDTTNEEIAVLIQNGNREYIPILWERVERLIYQNAYNYYCIHKEAFSACGVELDDLKQAGFFAMLRALEYYDKDSGYKFTTYLNYPMKIEFAEAGGFRTVKGREEPLNNSISCDAPSIADEEGSASILDMIVDEASLIPFERVIESGYAEYSRAIIEACMRSVLTPQEAEVIRDRYFIGKTYKAIAQATGATTRDIMNTERRALRLLRSPKSAAVLRPLLTSEPTYSTGLSSFKQKGSATERAAIVEADTLPPTPKKK